MSCNVVSCGGRGTLRHDNMFHNVSKIVLCDRHNAFARFSENELHISWQAQHFGHIHDVMCLLRGRRST